MNDRTTAETITVYADYVCPFCYLGRQALATYRSERDRPLEIDWRPFDLRREKRAADGSIDRAATNGKDAAYYDRARENVRRLQARYDVEMAQELAIDVDSRPAQLVSFALSERDTDWWEAFDAAVYEALWQQRRDIGETAVLVDLAASAGLAEPEATVREALADENLEARLEERFADAHRTGVTGVPTFVVDGHAARGAVPPEHLARLFAVD